MAWDGRYGALYWGALYVGYHVAVQGKHLVCHATFLHCKIHQAIPFPLCHCCLSVPQDAAEQSNNKRAANWQDGKLLGCDCHLLPMLQAACILVLWPVIIAGTAAGTYYIVVYSSDISQQLNTSYGPTICLSAVNIISGQLVYGSTLLENWDPRYKTDVSAGAPCPCCCLTLCDSPAPT